MKGTLFGSWDFLRYLRKIHIQYSVRRPETSQNAKDLILRLTAESVRRRHPQLEVTWEMLDFDAPATVESTLVNGVRHKQLIEGYSSAQRREIVDKWRFTANLEPWEEVRAPKRPASMPAAAAPDDQQQQQQQQQHQQQQQQQ
ncbi:hypothetical protein Efla_001259 [Eimeria flavescens]